MDQNEFDIYDDLFNNDEKKPEQSAQHWELCEKLKEAQEEIRQLKEENLNLKEQVSKHQKIEGALERNSCSLLITAKAEIKRKDDQITELRKEKDNIVFRRNDKFQKRPHHQTQTTSTQSKITCKPFAVFELKRVNDDLAEKLVERNHRRDENHTTNPFSSKSKENNDNKKTREGYADKNGNHRHQSRYEYSTREKHANQRSRVDERREQSNVERSKRRRSQCLSKDRKRVRRSRSWSREHRRDRNNHDQKSPDKPPRSQPSQDSPKRSVNKPEFNEKHHNKWTKEEKISKTHPSNITPVSENRTKEKGTELQNLKVDCDEVVNDVKMEIVVENHVPAKISDVKCEDLEDGEIDENSVDLTLRNNEAKLAEFSQIEPITDTTANYSNTLNTSGNKSVKNISTSSKDYLIVENENNETTIYITRKKKKKKKKILENV